MSRGSNVNFKGNKDLPSNFQQPYRKIYRKTICFDQSLETKNRPVGKQKYHIPEKKKKKFNSFQNGNGEFSF